MRSRRRAALLTSLIVAAGAAGAWWTLSPRLESAVDWRRELATAVGSSLPFEARLSGGFQPADRSSRRRADGARTETVRLSPDARIAIAELEKRASAISTAETLADVGVAYLVGGDVDRSIATLTESTTLGASARPLSDLSAAFLTKAEQAPVRSLEYVSRALEAATQSLRLAPSNEAAFNRALALDRLAPFVGDRAPWSDYLHGERDPHWVEAAKRHIVDDTPAPERRLLWEARRRELDGRLAALDAAFVEETARLYPEAVLDHFEQRTLAAWARAVLDRNPREAVRILERAELLSDAFARVTGDTLPREAVAAARRGTAALAHAHLAYVDGLSQHDQNDLARARTSFGTALAGFSRAASPYHDWAVVQLAAIQFQERDLDGADAALSRLERLARPRSHATLLGRVLWLRGLVFSKQWRLTEALSAFRESAARFESGHLRENGVSLSHHLADTLRTLGEQRESWEYIGRALADLAIVRKPIRRYLFLYNAALFASSQNLFEAALLFQNATVREAARADVAVEVDALTQRALIHTQRGASESARRDLEAASAYLGRTKPGFLRDYLNAELGILSAQIEPSDPASIGRLQQAVTFFHRAEPARIPRLYLALSRAQATTDRAAAERSLEEGIQQLERQHASMSDASLKVSYFDESWDLFDEMVTAQLATKGHQAVAFAYAERARARTLLTAAGVSRDTAAPLLTALQASLPPRTVLLYYVTLPNRVLIWTVTTRAVVLAESAATRAELNRLIDRHRSALVEGRESPVNDRLHEILIAPVIDHLSDVVSVVLGPDGALQQLPFATLRAPQTGRYLIEDFALAYAPSATFLLAGLTGHSPVSFRPQSALLVGNPAAAMSASLPGAETEASGVAGFYPRSEVLIGSAATRDAFLAEISASEVVHFGGHAVSNPEYPLLSRLLFAAIGSKEPQPLFAHELSHLRLPQTRVVVLAACSTAAGAVSRGEGVVSVARPFLAAGVQVVVASQWDVDDRATGELFVRFHHVLAETGDAVRALRESQLALLRSGKAPLQSPAHWGAFVALGTPLSPN